MFHLSSLVLRLSVFSVSFLLIFAALIRYLDIGVTLLKLAADNTYTLQASSGNSVSRENQVEAKVGPGRYVAIPTTTGCKFAMAVAQGGSVEPVALHDGDGKLNKAAETALREMFDRYVVRTWWGRSLVGGGFGTT